MADGACDYGEEPHGRNWILTHLDPPMSLELCDEHLAPGLIGLLAGDLGVDFTRFYAVIERFIAREAKQAEKDLAAAVAAEGQAPEDQAPDAPGGSSDAQEAEAEQGEPLYNHVECAYCGNYLDDGESHLHGGAPNPGDAEVPA